MKDGDGTSLCTGAAVDSLGWLCIFEIIDEALRAFVGSGRGSLLVYAPVGKAGEGSGVGDVSEDDAGMPRASKRMAWNRNNFSTSHILVNIQS